MISEIGDVNPVAMHVVLLTAALDVAVPKPRHDVLAERRRGGDQCAPRRRHHRSQCGRQHQSREQLWQLHLDESGKRVVAYRHRARYGIQQQYTRPARGAG